MEQFKMFFPLAGLLGAVTGSVVEKPELAAGSGFLAAAWMVLSLGKLASDIKDMKAEMKQFKAGLTTLPCSNPPRERQCPGGASNT